MCDTERLQIFAAVVPLDIEHYCVDRIQFLAYRTDYDRPMLCANMLVSVTGMFPGWIDWLEVASDDRREGLGRELLLGLEKTLGCEFELTDPEEGTVADKFVSAVIAAKEAACDADVNSHDAGAQQPAVAEDARDADPTA